MKRAKKLLVLLIGLIFLGAFTGCQDEGPAERAGKEIDEAVEKTQEQMEEAGDKIEESVDKAGEKIEEAGEDMQQSAN